jgi:hypothetical protein
MATIEINIHHRIDDNAESWQVSDTGGEFDDEEYESQREAEDDVEGRSFYYANTPTTEIGEAGVDTIITRT